MSRAKVEIINDEVKTRSFEDIEVGAIFEFEGRIYLKLDSGWEAVLLSQEEYLGCVTDFSYDDLVIAYDKAMITVRTRAK